MKSMLDTKIFLRLHIDLLNSKIKFLARILIFPKFQDICSYDHFIQYKQNGKRHQLFLFCDKTNKERGSSLATLMVYYP